MKENMDITTIQQQPEPKGEIVMYQPDGTLKLEVRLEDETVWLTQAQIAELFGTQRRAITKHLKNIFECGELDEKEVCSKMELTTQHDAIPNKTQTILAKIYNLNLYSPRERTFNKFLY